jgi:hypothetical protein
MPRNPHPQRRDFLKTAAAGAAGAMGISAFKFDKLFAQSTGGGWTTGMKINPAIDNTRVICCHDPSMLANYPTSGVVNSDFASQNSYADPAKIATNMDQMAMQLAQKTNAADAWSTIFRTGNSGGWGSTRVAIKVNGINGGSPTTDKINRTRVAVVKKICDVLVDQLGVKPGNIVLYDTCDDASKPYSTYVNASDSTKIRAATVSTRAAGLGGFAAVTLTNATAISAPADFVNGAIDILVNMPTCKMHNGTGGKYSYGSCTLGMKNHLGTFTDASKAQHSDGLHNLQALFEINKHSAILGGNPVRQQLVIVDALLSNGASGPGGSADNRTDRLVMGTFAPIVDYLTTNKILLDPTIMAKSPIPAAGITAAATILPQFLTSFGYTATDPQWSECTPPNWPAITGGGGGAGGSGGTATGGTSGSGGAASGGNKASGGAGSGGTSAGSGGNNASGGSASGGNNASGGSASGATSASGGSASGGSNASGGSASGGTNASGGSGSGGNNASGGVASGGTTSGSGGAGGTGGASASASGGSATTGGTTSGNRTGGSSGTPGSTAKSGNSEGGCEVAGVDRRATRWGAMLAFGAVVAEKLRRLVSGNDRSS